jgi:EAL domain-containing protein (putative c-di-GMP-specific phosphodiesterase class I)
MQARADAAMYQAKRPGSLKIALYREDDITADDALVASLEASALYQALANPEMIEMHYQRMEPLDDELTYLEALCRIRHENGLLSPARFMPIVQSRRLDADFDLAVIRRIYATIEAGQIPPGIGVSINLSAQSLGRPEVIALLIELTKFIEHHPLILEITETSLVPRLEEITYFLEILRSDGYKIALDDFGSGYSPLRYLSDLPVDIIKFDMALVHQLQDGGRAGVVVADFVRLMIDAGYTLVAEGIENEAQFAKVRSLGFSFAQGFLIERPRPVAELMQKYSASRDFSLTPTPLPLGWGV